MQRLLVSFGVLKLPATGILFLEGPKQTSREAHAGDGEQKRTPVALQDHLIGQVSHLGPVGNPRL